MWFKKRPTLSFQVGQYRLDNKVEESRLLREFSDEDYKAMGRQFSGEKNYNAQPVEFAGGRWNLMLGTVNGTIYKICAFLQFTNEAEATITAAATLDFCQEKVGRPTKQKVFSSGTRSMATLFCRLLRLPRVLL